MNYLKSVTRMNGLKGTRRRGLTPVISTIIIVSVTISASFSAAFFINASGYAFTGFEKLVCESAIPSYDFASKTWKISIVVKNIGTKTSMISKVYANEVALSLGVTDPAPGNGGVDIPDDGVSINQGATTSLNIYIEQGGLSQPFSDLVGRRTLLIKLTTGEGLEFVKICELCPPNA